MSNKVSSCEANEDSGVLDENKNSIPLSADDASSFQKIISGIKSEISTTIIVGLQVVALYVAFVLFCWYCYYAEDHNYAKDESAIVSFFFTTCLLCSSLLVCTAYIMWDMTKKLLIYLKQKEEKNKYDRNARKQKKEHAERERCEVESYSHNDYERSTTVVKTTKPLPVSPVAEITNRFSITCEVFYLLIAIASVGSSAVANLDKNLKPTAWMFVVVSLWLIFWFFVRKALYLCCRGIVSFRPGNEFVKYIRNVILPIFSVVFLAEIFCMATMYSSAPSLVYRYSYTPVLVRWVRGVWISILLKWIGTVWSD